MPQEAFIIECPECNAKNRVKQYDPSKVPVCAKCRTPLVDEDKNDAHARYSKNLNDFYNLPGFGLRNEK